MTAYDVQTFQISAPGWLSTARYDIAANVPAGATKEQVNAMWQNLLKERFGVALHHESKEFQVDELTVARGGLKLKETDLGPNPDPFTPPDGPPRNRNGTPEMNGFGAIVVIFPDGPRAQMTAKGLTLADLAARLGQQLHHPVIDRTGLTGRYDFTLEYTPDLSGVQLPVPLPGAGGPARAPGAPGDSASEPGSTLAAAVEKLGLKLSRGKAQLDVIVVDHAERVPTEN